SPDNASTDNVNDINYLNDNTIFEGDTGDIENNSEEIISNITKRKIFIKNPLNTEGIFENVKKRIYNALIYYWNTSHDAGLIASLLDSRYKELDFLLEDKKEKIIQKLRNEFNEMKPNNSISLSPADPSN